LKQLIAALTIDLLADAAADSEPPKRFRILKQGTFETSKGIFKFTKASASKVEASAKKYGNDFAIDYNHAMHFIFAPDPAEGGKAAGWFNAKVNDGELWAEDVRWTPKADKMLRDREYRYFSPTIRHSQNGEIEELLSVALTNTPATYGMNPLMASQLLGAASAQPNEGQQMETLLTLLGLAKNASEAEAVSALTKMMAALTELSTLTGQKEADGILGTVKAWKVGSEQAVALSQKVANLEETAKKAESDVLISKAKTDGKLPPAMETFARTLSGEQLKTFLAALPTQAVAQAPAQPPTGGVAGSVQLTAEEIQVATLMGTPLETVAKAKARAAGIVVIETAKPTLPAGQQQ
jgi:phage I-like protein